MRLLCLLLACACLLLTPSGALDARIVRIWTDQELLDKSDLVVVAAPTVTGDTPERGPLPGDERQPVIGVRTEFVVTSVLKGSATLRTVVLRHYRPDQMQVANGPTFVSFDPKSARSYRLYLVRQADGLYAPTAGQEDPGLSIREESVLFRANPATQPSTWIDDANQLGVSTRVQLQLAVPPHPNNRQVPAAPSPAAVK